MSINKDFYVPRREVKFGDQVVGTFRGVTPNDLAQILSENAPDMDDLVTMFRNDSALKSIDASDASKIADISEQHADLMFGKIIMQVPNLVAKLIAVAGDDADQAAFIRDNLPIPAQFEAVMVIAEMTFTDRQTFKDFLGKVMALVSSLGGGDQRVVELPVQPRRSTG